MSTVISVENLSKSYQLGQIGTGTFTHDLNVWWAKLRGKPNPLLRIGETDHGNRDGEELWALKDVSFKVEQGEVLGIIGRNGAGKSTLLKILSRVTAPTSGKIKVKGRIASLLEVGTGFHPDLTGRENTYLNGAILGMDRNEITRKFDEIVDFAGVEQFIDTPVKRYSSGMYVRLAFAVAAYLEPEILIIDEVLAVGDAEFQKKCLGKMGEVAKEGRTVLFVSHNMSAINSLCNTALYIGKGKLISSGSTREVIGKYLNEFDTSNTFDLTLQNIGDQFARLLRVRFIDDTHTTVDHLCVDKTFGVEIIYEIIEDNIHKPVPNIFLQTKNNEGVFQSIETRKTEIFKKGTYKSIVWIPENLLNNEAYKLTIGIATLNPVVVHCTQDMYFDVEDSLLAITRGEYKFHMNGVVRPFLKWQTVEVFEKPQKGIN